MGAGHIEIMLFELHISDDKLILQSDILYFLVCGLIFSQQNSAWSNEGHEQIEGMTYNIGRTRSCVNL